MNRQAQESVSSGSTTITSTPSELHLRGSEEPEDRLLDLRVGDNNVDQQPPASSVKKKIKKRRHHRIKWREDVVDNENMGKKKSKICCIYHRPKAFDESSSSSSSDSDADSSSSSCASSDNEHSREPIHQRNAGKVKPNKYETAPRYSPPPASSSQDLNTAA